MMKKLAFKDLKFSFIWQDTHSIIHYLIVKWQQYSPNDYETTTKG